MSRRTVQRCYLEPCFTLTQVPLVGWWAALATAAHALLLAAVARALSPFCALVHGCANGCCCVCMFLLRVVCLCLVVLPCLRACVLARMVQALEAHARWSDITNARSQALGKVAAMMPGRKLATASSADMTRVSSTVEMTHISGDSRPHTRGTELSATFADEVS